MKNDLIAAGVLLIVGGVWIGYAIHNPKESATTDRADGPDAAAGSVEQRERYVRTILKTIEDIDRDALMIGEAEPRDCSAFTGAPQSLYAQGWTAECFLSARDDPLAPPPQSMTDDERENFERHCRTRIKVPVTRPMADAYLAAVQCRMHNLAVTGKAAPAPR